MKRAGYCPIGGEPCQSLCEEPCTTVAELADLRALARLGRWCLDESRQHDCSDVDAASLQDKAIELGLLAYVEVSEPCGEACPCLEYHGSDGFPARCLRYTDRAILDADS